MKAKISVTEGSARVFLGNWKGARPTPTEAPYEGEVDGDWAVGSASSPGNFKPGKFTITPLEAGHLKVFTEDSGNISEMIPVDAGSVYSYDTIESNAYTVSAYATD